MKHSALWILLILIAGSFCLFPKKAYIPKIYDCFLFYNELELLEIRLQEMSLAVDYFVLVEASETFKGKLKPFFLKKINISLRHLPIKSFILKRSLLSPLHNLFRGWKSMPVSPGIFKKTLSITKKSVLSSKMAICF